jgi:hypothetical protein
MTRGSSDISHRPKDQNKIAPGFSPGNIVPKEKRPERATELGNVPVSLYSSRECTSAGGLVASTAVNVSRIL